MIATEDSFGSWINREINIPYNERSVSEMIMTEEEYREALDRIDILLKENEQSAELWDLVEQTRNYEDSIKED